MLKTIDFLKNSKEISVISKDSDIISNTIKNVYSIKTITNVTEILFSDLGEKAVKDSGFWMKSGLLQSVESQKYIIRHLIISALIYSQLNQTMIAEGMYRQCLELLKIDSTIENKANFSIALNMYGNLISKQNNRTEEGQQLIKRSEEVVYFDWYKSMCKMHYFDFDFE